MDVVNQKLIAHHLNISRTTVSRCFSNHRGISPRTRAQVFSLAAKLGYQYLQPEDLVQERSKPNAIGVLICSDADVLNRADYENPGSELLPGIAEFAQLHRWQTHVHFVSPRAESLADASYTALHGFKKRLWSGLLLLHAFSPSVIAELSARLPCVSFVEQYGQASVDCVDVNHYRGVTVMMDHLLRQGHTRIGFFTHRSSVEEGWSRRRLCAYVENLVRLGLRFHQGDVIHLDPTSLETVEEGYRRAAEQTRNGVTAWMCAADQQAYDLVSALGKSGFDVPGDVSVSGFDGILRPAGTPALDTVRIPYHEIGFTGSRRLYDKIHQRGSTQEILLECALQEGETVRPPRTTTARRKA